MFPIPGFQGTHCPAFFRCSRALTHLLQIIVVLEKPYNRSSGVPKQESNYFKNMQAVYLKERGKERHLFFFIFILVFLGYILVWNGYLGNQLKVSYKTRTHFLPKVVLYPYSKQEGEWIRMNTENKQNTQGISKPWGKE